MSIITLTTDWHNQDFYTGAVKGRILYLCPDARIIDIAHDIPSFNVRQAAFIIRNAYPHFPKGTIHLIGVLAEGKEKPLLVEHKGQYFIMADTGIVNMIFPDVPAKIFRLSLTEKSSLFPMFDIFVPAACKLASGKKPAEISTPVDDFKKTTPVRAAVDDEVITGSVIYIDSYANVVTNITRDIFDRIGNGRSFEIFPGTGSNLYRITRLNNSYHETAPGDILALFNTLELLEIAIYQGNAAELLGLTMNSSVRIKFKD